MKKTLILGLAALGLALAGCNNAAPAAAPAESASDSTAVAGSIVYFNIDKVMAGYDMANDLRSVLETKVQGIQNEVDRRGKKLEKDVNEFQQKIDKGLLTRSVAEVQGQKLQQQQQDYQQYAMRKQNEIAEEQQVTLNQIANAINEYVVKFNEEKQYALILTTSGDILPAPVVTGDPKLDITDELLQGLNDEYIKTKAAEKAQK
jgi:outer membrane protein